MSPPSDPQIRAALERILDPCSVAGNVPTSIVDLGLVRAWDHEDGQLRITLVSTSAACLMMANIVDAVERECGALPGVESVDVTLDHSVPWTPADISPEGRAAMERRQRESIAATGLRPQQWRTVHS